MIIPPTIPAVQLIPPQEATQYAVLTAATSLCLAFQGRLQPAELQPAMNRGLAHLGLRPVPPHQIVAIWGMAAQVVKHPSVCPKLLKP